MRFATSLIALAAPLLVAAAPWKRDASNNLLVLRTFPFLYLSLVAPLFRVFLFSIVIASGPS